jgi:RimJ/RimL family protein N-acetyltransferase
LEETPSTDYGQRTEWNVRDSDGTVVFSISGTLSGGSKETVEVARVHQKPVLQVFRDFGSPFPEREVLKFIRDNRIRVLNVAGPRASEEPDVGAFVMVVLAHAWDAAEEVRAATPPEIMSDRLVLRALTLADASDVARLAGRREIADTTISIPHPYSEQQARDWIEAHTGPPSADKVTVFAITLKTDGRLIGTMGLREIDREHSQAEMGFWIGTEWWGRGYATEAARAVLGYAFEELGLNRVYAHHMVRNPASGRVLKKVGMTAEGLLRQRVRKWGVFEDVVILAILRADWPKKAILLCSSKP